MNKRFILSGAITGHKEEARTYFEEAKKAILARYPTAEVFDPTRLPDTMSWEAAMVVCRMRVKGWATDIALIKNSYYKDSVGAAEEKELAKSAGLCFHNYHNGILEEVS